MSKINCPIIRPPRGGSASCLSTDEQLKRVQLELKRAQLDHQILQNDLLRLQIANERRKAERKGE